MILCLRANQFQKATQVMEKLDKCAHEILGVPDVSVLQAYVEKCVEEKLPTKAIVRFGCFRPESFLKSFISFQNGVQYCVENSFSEAGNLAKYINDNMTLDGTQLNKLIVLVGRDVLQLNKAGASQ